jgi:F0F1-type ATP synthase assembly protein I
MLGATTLSIMTFSITTLSKIISSIMLIVLYAEFHASYIVILGVIMLNVFMLSVVVPHAVRAPQPEVDSRYGCCDTVL